MCGDKRSRIDPAVMILGNIHRSPKNPVAGSVLLVQILVGKGWWV